jgi:hypothetical protein
MKKGWTRIAVPLLLAVIGCAGHAGAVTVQADRWDVLLSAGATVTQPSAGLADIKFAANFNPGEVHLAPASTDPSRLFAGDYAIAKIHALLVTLKGVNVGRMPDGSLLQLSSGGNTWVSYNLATAFGQNVSNRISTDRASGGWMLVDDPGLDAAALNARWGETLSQVDSVKIIIPKGDDGAHITVSAFALDGDRAVQSLTPLEAALLARFGVTTAAEVASGDAAIDSDGDGMTDLAEILAENDPAWFSANFKAELADSNGGITISWMAVKGRTYTLVRDTTMFGNFTEVIFSSTATDTAIMSHTDTDAAVEVQYFYRVIQN